MTTLSNGLVEGTLQYKDCLVFHCIVREKLAHIVFLGIGKSDIEWHRDIGVRESNNYPIGSTLGLTGSGADYSNFK